MLTNNIEGQCSTENHIIYPLKYNQQINLENEIFFLQIIGIIKAVHK